MLQLQVITQGHTFKQNLTAITKCFDLFEDGKNSTFSTLFKQPELCFWPMCLLHLPFSWPSSPCSGQSQSSWPSANI